MGNQRTHARFSGDIVFDADALIALEPADKELVALRLPGRFLGALALLGL